MMKMIIESFFSSIIMLICFDVHFKPYKCLIGSFKQAFSDIRITTENAGEMISENYPKLLKIACVTTESNLRRLACMQQMSCLPAHSYHGRTSQLYLSRTIPLNMLAHYTLKYPLMCTPDTAETASTHFSPDISMIKGESIQGSIQSVSLASECYS